MAHCKPSPPGAQHSQAQEFATDPATGGVLIPLGSRKYPGRFAIVDAGDIPLVGQYRWSVNRNHRVEYAFRNVWVDGKQRRISMHRLILGLTDPRLQTDHINHNGLDNRRENLRIVTIQQNAFNRRSNQRVTSRFKGVCWDKKARKWRAKFQYNGIGHYVGLYTDEVDAARAYDAAVIAHQLQFANLNLPDEPIALNFPDTKREAA